MANAFHVLKIAIIAATMAYVSNVIQIIHYLIMENAVNVLITAVYVLQMKIMKLFVCNVMIILL